MPCKYQGGRKRWPGLSPVCRRSETHAPPPPPHILPISPHGSVFESYIYPTRSRSNSTSYRKSYLILSTCRNGPFVSTLTAAACYHGQEQMCLKDVSCSLRFPPWCPPQAQWTPVSVCGMNEKSKMILKDRTAKVNREMICSQKEKKKCQQILEFQTLYLPLLLWSLRQHLVLFSIWIPVSLYVKWRLRMHTSQTACKDSRKYAWKMPSTPKVRNRVLLSVRTPFHTTGFCKSNIFASIHVKRNLKWLYQEILKRHFM